LDALPDGVLPEHGALSVTVPGAVRSWEDVGRAHGTRGFDELLEPAERYAREGFALTDVVAAYLALNEPVLRADAESARIFLRRGVPRAGDVFRNPELADTIAAIRRGGADAFYAGTTGERIVTALTRRGNRMTLADLVDHRTEPTTPLRLQWHGGELVVHPPNSQAVCLLIAAGILAGDGDADEPLWAHLAVEASKDATAYRDARLCDPAFGPTGAQEALDPARLRAARAAIDPAHAGAAVYAGNRGGTISLNVVDENGMAVTLIESLYMNFGSGIVADGTGVVLQNRGAWFSTQPGHPNVYEGGKRPVHTLSPPMFLRDGKPEVAFGTMGGEGQPQILLQVLHNLVERGLDPQSALDAPRWVYGRSSMAGRPELDVADSVVAESRLAPDVITGLERRGHRVVTVGPYENVMGHAHAIVIDRAKGTLAGGGDPRADSLALGL
ncbi:MAG: gamma-glutamyltransferase, partial [Candidatus Eremiobacteraeota bacterium]|nr:gamma-glutamyltransferase [Candidatus Eremiobacteraeota bacterium]